MKKSDDFYADIRRKKLRRNAAGLLAGLLVLLIALGAGIWLRETLEPEPDVVTTSPPAPPEPTATAQVTAAATQPEETTPATEPERTVSPETEAVMAVFNSMSLEEKICQFFIVRPEALCPQYPVTQAPENLDALLAQYPVGGVALFGSNIENRDQCTALTGAFQSASRVPLFICVDEEGGSVSRIGSNSAMGTTAFPDMAQIEGTQNAYNVGFTIGSEIKALGFNVDFAPVADVNTNPNNPVIGPRSFGSDPETVASMVEACVEGFREAGMISCLKHFPGHGDTSADSHTGSVSIDKTLEQLEQAELPPFRSGMDAGVPMVMVGHIACPNITGNLLPASLSSKLVGELLRQQMGYEGLIVTDAMDMAAITDQYGPGEAAVMALEAGCDMVLLPADLAEATAAVRQAIEEGRLNLSRIDESVLRILRLKLDYGIIPTP